MAAGGCSKSNSNKSRNVRRKMRKSKSWANGQARKDKNRHVNDYKPGFKPPSGDAQNKVPFLLKGVKPPMLTPLQRDDKKPVYERVT